MALPRGTTIQPLEKTSHFDIESVETWNNWMEIPGWIQEKIKKAENYESSGLSQFVKEYEEMKKENTAQQNSEPMASADDLPF